MSRWFATDSSRKITLCFTNVPGPINRINVFGRKLKQMGFALNAPGKIGLMFGCFTYNDELTISGTIDSSLADSPTEILQYFIEEVNSFSQVN